MSCYLTLRRAPLPLLVLLPLLGSPCLAQPAGAPEPHRHQHHSHSVGPAGATYDLRWLDAMQHHGGALAMAHEALSRSPNSTIRRLARSIGIEQRREIIELRGMLHHSGLNKPEYHHFDSLFRF